MASKHYIASHIKLATPTLLRPARSSKAEHQLAGQDARQDGLGGDQPGALLASTLPPARRRQPQQRRRWRHARRGLLRAEPVPGLARRRHRQDGHLGALHAGAQPHGVAPPLPLLRRPRLLLQPLLPRPQGQVRGRPQGRAGRQGLAGDRGHRGGGPPGRRGRAPAHAQALQVLPHLRRRLRRPLHLLRPRALGRVPLPEAPDRHEEHHVPELHHPGGHGRVAGAHGHGHHQLHRQVHLQEHRHLLRHPRHRRPIHALLLTAQPRRRRPEEVLPGAEQPSHGERERDGEQGAALRQRTHSHGAADKGRARRQGVAGADDAAHDGAVQGVRAGRAGAAAVHQGGGVQGGHGPGQAQQGHLARQGLPVLLNSLNPYRLVDRVIDIGSVGQVIFLSSFAPLSICVFSHASPLRSFFCIYIYYN